jgi:hypothetical protein
MTIQPKFLLIIKPQQGLYTLDTPRPRGEGAQTRRTLAKGAQVYAYDIFNFQGVKYAWLVPADPLKPEWCRVAERGSQVNEYCEEIPLDTEGEADSGVTRALERIADALGQIADALANSP